jgi:hypothetical protein
VFLELDYWQQAVAVQGGAKDQVAFLPQTAQALGSGAV